MYGNTAIDEAMGLAESGKWTISFKKKEQKGSKKKKKKKKEGDMNMQMALVIF